MPALAAAQPLPSLTGIRALAALWVLLFHLNPQFILFFGSCPLLTSFFSQGFYGVDLFFVLSGFIISYKYFDMPITRKNYLDFLRWRIARIYPLHLAMLFLMLVFILGAFYTGHTINQPGDYTIAGFFAHLLMVSAWRFPMPLTWNHFAWSVSAEWLAYILFPVFILIFRRGKKPWRLLPSMLLLGFICSMADLAFQFDSPAAYAVFRILCGFSLGVAVYRLYQARYKIPARLAEISLLLIVAMAIAEALFFPGIRFLLLPFFALLIYGLSNQQGALSRILGNRFFQYGGCISYAVYITQFVVLLPIRKMIPPESVANASGLLKTGYISAEMVLVLGFSVFCYHVIEEPARKWLGKS
jgi:peptidoglycan/LPS O-acetylase OafA/YrhL